MIKLELDWREVLWWMQGGMAGSHLRWSVYEDMVNRVWPQASEQERRNMFLIMRRDLGSYWRPKEWNGHSHMTEDGEGPWREDIFDKTPWIYFRQVMARFDPDNQYAVTMKVKDGEQYSHLIESVPGVSIISRPFLCHIPEGQKWESCTTRFVIRTYKWEGEYYVDWSRRCDETKIVKVGKLDIPDDGTM